MLGRSQAFVRAIELEAGGAVPRHPMVAEDLFFHAIEDPSRSRIGGLGALALVRAQEITLRGEAHPA